MKRGPQSLKLSFDEIEELRKFQLRQRWGIEELRDYMGMPFRWPVLSLALRGKPIRLCNHKAIVDWIYAHEEEIEGHAVKPRSAQVPAVRG